MAVKLQIPDVNYSEIPLIALRHSTRSFLSQSLNGTKIIPSPSNLPRDWRGLSHLAGITSPHVNSPDPTAAVLSEWERKENSSVQVLLDSLKEIDRWDVLDDAMHLVEKDVEDYLKTREVKVNKDEEQNVEEDNILTIDDIRCIGVSGQPQYYDAFLLFDDSDKDFALRILEKLENEFGLKLCCKDRDLVGGLPFEYEAIMKLIRDRCRRLIVVVSPVFLESPANKFLLTFAQALGIEQRQRKIIPCVYLKFKFPPQLNYYFVLDFTRSSSLWNFWDRLSESIRAASPGVRALPPASSPSSVRVVEVLESSSHSNSLSVDKWDCKKTPVPSAPPCESNSTSPASSSPKCVLPLSDSASTVESLNGSSETEPILHSRTSSTVSLLSKVFTPKNIKPKWFKKKKKVVVAS